MSTAGSVRSGASPYTPPDPKAGGSGAAAPRPRRTRIFRWQGIIPITLMLVLFGLGWLLLADRLVKNTMTEAGSKALGAQLDIGSLTIRALSTTLEMRGVALADPFDRNRNLFEIGQLVVALEPEPLLQKKFVVRQLSIRDVRTGTSRSEPARPVSGGGFAPAALAQVKKFTEQFKVPLLSLTPIDTLKALVLDPSQLQAVQSALALGRQADSAKTFIESGYNGLRLQETFDSSAALITRLQSANVRTLGVQGTRAAVADLRRAIARVDSAKGRVERLVGDVRRSVDSLQAGVAAVDAARQQDYAFARGLLQLPSFDAPDIGSALFGQVTIDRFEQAMYWATLARQYAPPGLLPKESDGPKRVRGAGKTVHFVTPESYPRFLLRRANINVTFAGASPATYAMAASDVTSEPSIVGRPTRFLVRRASRGGAVDSLRIDGSLDHLGRRPKEVVNAQAAGVALPRMSVPGLPLAMDPGRGASQLRFVFDGDQLSGRWAVRSSNLTWIADSTRARRLNTLESLVTRVLTGIHELELTAEISGTLAAPRMAVTSNLDRQIADRLRAVAGEEIAAARQKARAQVDRLVEEKSAPVKARIEALKAESETRIAAARTRLDDEKRKLEERIKAFGLSTIVG
jgi:uncharacterized protein (TIGR03545 family)